MLRLRALDLLIACALTQAGRRQLEAEANVWSHMAMVIARALGIA